ncbi:TetR/AcrR family transcriptional regulator [Streptosporangium sp. NBC_01639]|uniref:TetR/AcrR family transcriptional regulator n=1 Tax=Streptosporangium sp. NBC_01639 TaxID=2975948 RepID=UPI0038651763|nr:TetR/AcrR family transcriptional regulator [Streptosporangium sp. NBC_01639]
MNTTRPGRRPRADARRNYERLLAEADSAFRENGTEASLENIARRAGVAIGTLYGHFPNRRALVGALLQDRNDVLFETGDRLLAHPSAAEALTGWVHAVVEHAAVYRGLVAMLIDGLDDDASELHESCVRMSAIGERLIANAHAAGVIRHDATGADVAALMNAAAWVREQMPEEQADRFLRFAMDGLRPAGG